MNVQYAVICSKGKGEHKPNKYQNNCEYGKQYMRKSSIHAQQWHKYEERTSFSIALTLCHTSTKVFFSNRMWKILPQQKREYELQLQGSVFYLFSSFHYFGTIKRNIKMVMLCFSLICQKQNLLTAQEMERNNYHLRMWVFIHVIKIAAESNLYLSDMNCRDIIFQPKSTQRTKYIVYLVMQVKYYQICTNMSFVSSIKYTTDHSFTHIQV